MLRQSALSLADSHMNIHHQQKNGAEKERHFLSYTIEHILGTLMVVSVAVFVGYGAAAADPSFTSFATATTPLAGATLPPPVLTLFSVIAGKVELTWSGVTVGTTAQGFAVYRNDTLIANTTLSRYQDISTLVPGAIYMYVVKTIDTTGNFSLNSNIITVQIPASTVVTANTLSTTSATLTYTSTVTPILSVISTNLPVSFGVTVSPSVECSSGKPMTEVLFIVSDILGGNFQISSDNGVTNGVLDWGTQRLPNGKYYWRGVPKSGYSLNGDQIGTFTLANTCAIEPTTSSMATSSVTTPIVPTTPASAFPLKYPESTSIIPSVAMGNTIISFGGTVFGTAAFNVVARGSRRTVFVLESQTGKKQVIDKISGVVHRDGSDEWSVLFNTATLPNGEYSLAALIDTSAGTVMISKRFLFTVKNDMNTIQYGLLGNLKHPVLKIYINNVTIPTGAAVTSGSEMEFRIVATNAKKVNFYAMRPNEVTPIDLGQGVVDDLLSAKSQDVWTATWKTEKNKEGVYKLYARVLFLDGVVGETLPVPISIGQNISASITDLNSGISSTTLVNSSLSIQERNAILARITDPSQCVNADECKVFCTNNTLKLQSCVAYARIILPMTGNHVSLTDGIPEEHMSNVLADMHKRSDIPDTVKNPADLRSYCADPAHIDSCSNMLTKNDMMNLPTLEEKKNALIEEKATEMHMLGERTGARGFIDSDSDGISDFDEVNIYHTNPSDFDTDYDGVPDGIELMEHTNPHGNKKEVTSSSTSVATFAVGEGVDFEDPLITGSINKEMLHVDAVQVAEVGEGVSGSTTATKLVLSGKALPNSFVTLFIFSEPIVVTVKADNTGAWTYTLNKELADGSHKVVSAITDEGGHILAKSETLPFVKVAAAVSVGGSALLPSSEKPGFFSGPSLYAFIAILIGLIGVAFSIIGFVVHQRGTKEGGPLFPPSAPV